MISGRAASSEGYGLTAWLRPGLVWSTELPCEVCETDTTTVPNAVLPLKSEVAMVTV